MNIVGAFIAFLIVATGSICFGKKSIMNGKQYETRYVILAGGSGSRLWPLSNVDKPKQLIPFLDSPTLLEQTIQRITPIARTVNDIIIVTHERYHNEIAKSVNEKIGKIIAEPRACNTAPAVLNAAFELQKEEDPILIILPSDHFIPDEEPFRALLEQACDFVARDNQLAILGARPTRPATGYGYIQVERHMLQAGCHHVLKFHEKPIKEVAQDYLDSGNYFWNMGIVIGRCSTFLKEFKQHSSDMFDDINNSKNLVQAYERFSSISLDCAILEKTKNIVVFPWAYEWHDVGNLKVFLDLHKRFARKKKNQHIVEINGSNNLLSTNKKIVACIGVNNLCVVETDGVLLIANQEDVELVKQVAEKVKDLKLDSLKNIKIKEFECL